MKKLCEATRKPEDAPHGTIHKSDCHKEKRGKRPSKSTPFHVKKYHRSQTQRCVHTGYLGKETLGLPGGVCGDRAGEYLPYTLGTFCMWHCVPIFIQKIS